MKNGSAFAALLSAMVACLTLAVVNLMTELSSSSKEFVHGVGKFWLPGAEGIGPYSGKETFMLLGWIISWFIFSWLLKKRNFSPYLMISIFVMGMVMATMLIWPPFYMKLWHH